MARFLRLVSFLCATLLGVVLAPTHGCGVSSTPVFVLFSILALGFPFIFGKRSDAPGFGHIALAPFVTLALALTYIEIVHFAWFPQFLLD
jgi:hypothetical protein